MNQNENDYVSLVRIPRKWFNVFVWTFSSLVIANVLIEFFTDWAWQHLGETVLNTNCGSNDANSRLVLHISTYMGGYHVRVCKTIQRQNPCRR